MGVWRNIRLKEVLQEVKRKNKDLSVTRVLSVTNSFGFVEQQKLFGRKLASKDISSYKVIERGDFAYNPARINVGSIVLLEDFDGGIISPMYAAFRCLDGLDKRFFRYWLGGHSFRVQMLASLRGSVREVLSFRGMGQMRIKLPPLEEQEKIAEILNLWDAQIAEVQDLIHHKQRLKTGLMQKLFTQSLRLKGFTQDWEISRLENIATIKKGKQRNKNTLSAVGDFPVINGGVLPSGYLNEWNTQANTITISEGGESCGYVNFIKTKFWNGGHSYSLLDIKENINPRFLYYFLKSRESSIMRLRVGSALPNIQKKDISNLKVFSPSLEEQEKIAEILSAADEEIELLVQKHQALETQKRALMQRLLTGKVRV